MKKKVLILVAVAAALAIGVFSTSVQNNSPAINKAYGDEVVVCIAPSCSFCIIDNMFFWGYVPYTRDGPVVPKPRIS